MSEPKSRRIPKPIWFVLAAVLMVVLWVFLSVWLPYHREQLAIREIERFWPEIDTIWDGPEWLQDGPEWLQERVDDGWLSWFDRVYFLIFSQTPITDKGMKHLSDLTHLELLYLHDTQVGDEGMKHLSGLNNLRVLALENTLVSDEGLKHLGGLTNLEVLDLGDTQVSDKGLKHVSGLRNLNELHLYNTQISDEGLKHLSGLTKLEALNLLNTKITNEGLKHLRSLTHLEELILINTKVSDEGVKKLQKALPACKINHKPFQLRLNFFQDIPSSSPNGVCCRCTNCGSTNNTKKIVRAWLYKPCPRRSQQSGDTRRSRLSPISSVRKTNASTRLASGRGFVVG